MGIFRPPASMHVTVTGGHGGFVAPATGTDYVRSDEVAVYIGIDAAIGNDAGKVATAATTGSRHADTWCRRTFELSTTSATAKVFTPVNEFVVAVDDFWDPTGLVVKTDDDGDGVFETTWTADQYELTPPGTKAASGADGVYEQIRAVNVARQWPVGTGRTGSVQITARWGWPRVPDLVRAAVLELAKDAYAAPLTRSGLLVDANFGAAAVRQNPYARAWLANYRRNDR